MRGPRADTAVRAVPRTPQRSAHGVNRLDPALAQVGECYRSRRPPRTAVAAPAPDRPRKRFRKRRIIVPLLLLLIMALVAWPLYLYSYGSSKLSHVSALSGAEDTPGRTILFAGTDKRSEEGINDGVEGQRSDSIMLVHIPETGNPSLISLPRDTYVEIPGYGAGKLNSAYSRGGPELLVETVEGLSGLTVDHYVEVGMDGIANLVGAVGGVELCLDYDVSDSFSGLEWQAGCHVADGTTALAFSRMRYADPLGDIGRTARQRQVIAQVINEVMTPSVLLNPFKQRDVVGSTAEVLTVDQDTNLLDLVRVAMPLRGIMGPDGIIGTPPIADMNYYPGGVGSTVLLDPNTVDEFFAKVRDGSITQDDVAVNLP
ncbi:LCP family protein [Flaviflexus massiliensis]|uniref:LCP family protein n=1 Tax=Flaviflexus massiliensis TaxID=1522309 RepID=UPI000AFACFAC|nr:LCP family protein [Flaviflexus massiliensis]